MRATLLLAAAGLLAGCSSRSDYQAEEPFTGGSLNPGLYSSMTARGEDSTAGPMSPQAALPVEAGQLVTVRARRYANGFSQEIVLAGDRLTRGENRIEIVMRTETEGDRYDNLVPLNRFTDADIFNEMQAKFPGVAMSRHDFVLQNAYGPYGVAMGRVGGLTCAYAWQWIEDLQTGRKRFSIDPTQASIRVRLCRSTLTADQMSRLVSQLVIGRGAAYGSPSMGYGAPQAANADALGVAADYGAPRRGRRFDGYSSAPDVAPQPMVAAAPEARPVRFVERRVKRPRVAARRTPKERPEAQEDLRPPVYAPSQYQGQPGFTNAPGQTAWGAPAQPAYAVPQPTPAAPAAPQALDGTLPPQAYRGPGRVAPPRI